MPKVISANRLTDGIVVYAGHGGTWVERLDQAQILASKEDADAGLLLAKEDARRNLVVEPALVDVAEMEGGRRPATLRESIRAQGPTIDFLPRTHSVAREAELLPEISPARPSKSFLSVTEREGTRNYAPHGDVAKLAGGLARSDAR
ncbi:MAG: DUF2849 domain-containing protein [Beijerinckiaceae bacterium]|nr:DUF2849 domain-containing protein [Beijerinckiaceae bacterium]